MLDPQTVRFSVVMPNNEYFGIGFGSTMYNCDMVVWFANGQNSQAVDLYSYDHGTPRTDSQQDYKTSFTVSGSTVTFTSDRLLSTGD